MGFKGSGSAVDRSSGQLQGDSGSDNFLLVRPHNSRFIQGSN